MHPTSPLQELTYWLKQRAAIMDYIETAADSGQRQARLDSFAGTMRKIDAKILRLEAETHSAPQRA